jgi:acyl carrier protein
MSTHLPKLQEIIEELIGPNGPEVTEGASMVDMGLDSLDREELAMVVEERFDIRLSTAELERLSKDQATIKDWTDHLDQKA